MTSCVAISTTGDLHRLPFLSRTVRGWDRSGVDSMYVTVDGDEAACQRVLNVVSHWTGSVYRVGQPLPPALGQHVHKMRDGKLGVAVNKNTGLELMMTGPSFPVEHFFLSDDDIFPKNEKSIHLHMDSPMMHSMVCWGSHRLGGTHPGYAEWDWPRGSMLYVKKPVVNMIGGMIEAFGPGGHEHVEWSRRIHAAGLSIALYPSPLAYSREDARTGHSGMGAADYWDAVDMPLDGEHIGNYGERKARITSVQRDDDDQRMIDDIMRRSEGCKHFVPYWAAQNNRASATLYPVT
jgi:hypothetical protein